MARELKPLKVETITDAKTRQQVELFFDRNEKRFYADVAMKRVEAASAYECQKLVEREFAAYKSPEWKRVIWLKLDPLEKGGGYGWGQNSHQHERTLEFAFERIELGKKPDGDSVRRPFMEDLDERDATRQASNELAFAGNMWADDLKHIIPYSEAAWATLIELEAAMEQAHAKLASLFNAKDNGRGLVARSSVIGLLGGGK